MQKSTKKRWSRTFKMEIFSFSLLNGIALSPLESKKLLGNERVTINLGMDQARCISDGNLIRISFQGRIFEINKEALEFHTKRRSILVIEEKRIYEAEVRTQRAYYKLVPLNRVSEVTLEINGIHMHRVKGTSPLDDAKRKVAMAGVKNNLSVLEVGTGLGYTTISSLKFGAKKVVTIEKDENVLWLAERNPWSRGLLSNRIIILKGDAFYLVDEINERFDVILHDPPRFMSDSGMLYSEEFYRKLRRLIKPRGRMFHYIGDPGRLRGKSLRGKVARRLKRSGFSIVRYDEESMGLIIKA
ncbi:MAG: methyltransferase [Caldisphaeraceae archaeon]|nr:methyltransferase [Caldisphaeraceae archaeon]